MRIIVIDDEFETEIHEKLDRLTARVEALEGRDMNRELEVVDDVAG